jgi:hypothetical protein
MLHSLVRHPDEQRTQKEKEDKAKQRAAKYMKVMQYAMASCARSHVRPQVRFFERKKLVRRIHQTEKQLKV